MERTGEGGGRGVVEKVGGEGGGSGLPQATERSHLLRVREVSRWGTLTEDRGRVASLSSLHKLVVLNLELNKMKFVILQCHIIFNIFKIPPKIIFI
jgi:hypothetical protein